MNGIKNQDQLIFGLDIGTRSIVGTVGYRENANMFRVVAQVIKEHETRAMLDGQIHDIGKVSETIGKVKRELEQQLGLRLMDVCIAAAGRLLRTITARADCDLGEETVITDEHIYSLNLMGVEKAYEVIREQTQSEDINFYCVGYSVIHYYLNDYPISNLEGHKAAKISSEMIATFLPEDVIDGLYRAVERAGLFVANLTLEPIAAINVAIPEKFRLLNIALVDVGAGTSDICITRDGSIIAYGMIPYAGDELTEHIAKEYLTDFQTAESIKTACSTEEWTVYEDVIGISHKVETREVVEKVTETIRDISKKIADKIIELNGDKPVSAVFLVGGGGKIPTFTDVMADFLNIMPERVALRGEEVLTNVEFLQEDIIKDSLLVTPIGICLNYYEQKNRFIFVNVNGERVKLYDNNKLTIVDAALQIGIQNEYLFPRRGKALTFTVDGKKRMVRGKEGEAAVVTLNGKPAGINSELQANDVIDITYSTVGEDASCAIERLSEYKQSITFKFNDKNVICPKFAMANDELVSGFYEISEGDAIRILNYYTLKQVLDFMDIPAEGDFYVNHVKADMDEKIYDNFSILSSFSGTEAMYADFRSSFRPSGDSKYGIFREIAYMEGAEAGYVFEGMASEEEREEDHSEEKQEVEQDVAASSDEVKQQSETAGQEQAQNPESGTSGEDSRIANTEAGKRNPESPTGLMETYAKEEEEDGITDPQEGSFLAPKPLSQAATAGSFHSTIYPPVSSSRSSGAQGEEGRLPAAGASPDADGLQSARQRMQASKEGTLYQAGEHREAAVHVIVNGEPVGLSGKHSYIFVDILDAYPFDTTTAKGSMLDLKINGLDAEFTSPIKEGDVCKIEWKD